MAGGPAGSVRLIAQLREPQTARNFRRLSVTQVTVRRRLLVWNGPTLKLEPEAQTMWNDDFARRWTRFEGFTAHWADELIRRRSLGEGAVYDPAGGTIVQQVRRGAAVERRVAGQSDMRWWSRRLGENRGQGGPAAVGRRQGLFRLHPIRSRLGGGYEPEWCHA
jgi:hypothetical protein